MANVPRYAWPEPRCYLEGSVLHVGQARWRQELSFLPLVEPAKWMVYVKVGTTVVYGTQIGSPPGAQVISAAAMPGEMPLSTTSFSIDLAAYGVNPSDPLYPLEPLVTVEQYAASRRTTTGDWVWCGMDWERTDVVLRTFIDGRGGIPAAATISEPGASAVIDAWIPMDRCLYDESVPLDGGPDSTSADYNTLLSVEPFGATNGSFGMQFQTLRPDVTIDGAQVWIPEYRWGEPEPNYVPDVLRIRLWESSGVSNNVVVAYVELNDPGPGWNNVFFDEPYIAKTNRIMGTPSADNPHPYVPNPAHNGWYTIGIQAVQGAYHEHGEDEVDYNQIYPEHEKSYVQDNYGALSNLLNRQGPAGEKGPEWAPKFGNTRHLFVGPIMTYTPVYPLPAGFVPQIYRRVIQSGVS